MHLSNKEKFLKPFVDPLLWFFAIQAILLFYIGWYQTPIASHKGVMTVFIISLVLLFTLSLPVGSLFLKRSLDIYPQGFSIETFKRNSQFKPDYIWVLGGGYVLGDSPSEDILTSSSLSRLTKAYQVWKLYPYSKLVMAGASYYCKGRPTGRAAELMKQEAQNLGVPEDKIILEPFSINTRAHPIEALKLSGISAHTPIFVVTSEWHLRRARQEFKRYFDKVVYIPARKQSGCSSFAKFLPSSGALRASTTYIREWVGSFWYAVLSFIKT